jgi:glycosidase
VSETGRTARFSENGRMHGDSFVDYRATLCYHGTMARSMEREFHVSREARERYDFDDALFSLTGNVIFTDPHAAREVVQAMNAVRDLARFPEEALKAGDMLAMGLIDEILHYVVRLYCKEKNSLAMEQALAGLFEKMGEAAVDDALLNFVTWFPPLAVHRGKLSPAAYLEAKTAGIPNRQVAMEEMLLLWLANMNPAFSPFKELFDDIPLKEYTIYLSIVHWLWEFFHRQPPFGPFDQNLIAMLRSPAIEVPHSLPGQLEYIRSHWSFFVGTAFLEKLLQGLDMVKEEEERISFPGPGPAEVYRYFGTGLELESEQFSPDRDWMPRLVLMAKNIYVWLDQLSKEYRKGIARLDEVPDAELDRLQRNGFTGLWLIGVWERSPASQTIKQYCGNPEAVPSAYSLFDYQIAVDLGGEEAYLDLKDRAWKRGVRLASDMVPNHVGIYSRWVLDHPDWFVSMDRNPFPWYTFGGPDLSKDSRVSLSIEDHYYERTDAAVVFKRTDRQDGSETYVYHGNDGTSMPWNDTAQLNYLNPELREAMIQVILHVARKFPVIRFDAAMTLTKKHYQRLWFPEPGTGGAIPTRAACGLSKEDFDRLMPNEFWREVVDRVAAEAPDTLLLAEAFWLLEGYFVRTLGMHRVYNSAFMNMLRDEENAKYRTVMKNTMEFDPEILRRFVNFMNNPDERTAVDQFGKDDKYFGVCTLMITLPGLPMFGHGQIEGFSEKYGMEYKRAYFDETADGYLKERHEREIFPLLHKRYLFAGVECFFLYDFFTGQGAVNEDVYAYSNRYGDEKGLVIYNNSYTETSGWIRTSVASSVQSETAGESVLEQHSLAEGLSVSPGGGLFTLFRDSVTNLWYIRKNGSLLEKGLFVELGAYKYRVFLDFYEVNDNEWLHYARLADHLDGRGTPDIEEAMEEMLLLPIRDHFRELVGPATFRGLSDAYRASSGEGESRLQPWMLDELEGRLEGFLRKTRDHAGARSNASLIASTTRGKLEAILAFASSRTRASLTRTRAGKEVLRYLDTAFSDEKNLWGFFGWCFVRALYEVFSDYTLETEEAHRWLEKLSVSPALEGTFQQLGLNYPTARETTALIMLMIHKRSLFLGAASGEFPQAFPGFMGQSDVREYLNVNRHDDVLWFSKEGLETLLHWVFVVAAIEGVTPHLTFAAAAYKFRELYVYLQDIEAFGRESGYRFEKFLEEIAGWQPDHTVPTR